mmetsp:Transcript_2223/g.3357  ORF Transcript_2223/g.3357 Transcript_2223/m.3357 type:complete len:126 (-) Transcript_2223:1264-1641(-)
MVLTEDLQVNTTNCGLKIQSELASLATSRTLEDKEIVCLGDEGSDFILSESPSESRSIIFTITKCDNATIVPGSPTCISPDEIEEFINNVEIQTWSHQQLLAYDGQEEGSPLVTRKLDSVALSEG